MKSQFYLERKIIKMRETRTFTLGEKAEECGFTVNREIFYCSYCGEKAKEEDIGSSHNHRWEECIVRYCNCETAKKEQSSKEYLSKYRNRVIQLERELKEFEKMEDNEIVNTMKYNKELETLKKKFKMK